MISSNGRVCALEKLCVKFFVPASANTDATSPQCLALNLNCTILASFSHHLAYTAASTRDYSNLRQNVDFRHAILFRHSHHVPILALIMLHGSRRCPRNNLTQIHLADVLLANELPYFFTTRCAPKHEVAIRLLSLCRIACAHDSYFVPGKSKIRTNAGQIGAATLAGPSRLDGAVSEQDKQVRDKWHGTHVQKLACLPYPVT